MKYLLIALLNGIYGVMTLRMLTKDTPGYYFVFTIALVISVLGAIGVVLYIMTLVSGEKNEESTLRIKNWFQFAKNIDIVLIVGLLFRAFILQPYIVDGGSMEENFHNNEYILVDQISYRFRAPEQGESIVFHPPVNPGTSYIKRIIGLPGETVTIANNIVSVNSRDLTENYTFPESKTLTSTPDYTITLKPDEYFVMGDNREHSSDSREWGPVTRQSIVGRAWLVVYPRKYLGLVKNPIFSLAGLPLASPGLTPSPTSSL